MSFDSMSPMDAFRWFDTPRTSYPTTQSGTVELVPGDVRRVVLVIGNPSSSIFTVGIDPNPPSGQGIQVNNSTLPLIITQAEHGPLAQMQWFVTSSLMGGQLTVIEVKLRDWPRKEVDNAARQVQALAGTVNGVGRNVQRSNRRS